MAYIDQETGDVVVRLAFDGASAAGKTTNVRQLHERLFGARPGELTSPDSVDRETLFFDWRELDAGMVQGRKLRLQVISLPGQPSRLHRRRHLLGLADGVVFVVDADPDRHGVNVAMARELRAVRAWRDFVVVVQQNKVDLARRAADVLLGELGLPDSTPVVDANAAGGQGVSATFLAAARLLTERLREDLDIGTIAVRNGGADADRVLAELRELDRSERPSLPMRDDIIAVSPTSTLTLAATVFSLASPVPAQAWTTVEAQLWRGGGHIVETSPAWSCETIDEARAVFAAVIGRRQRWKLADVGVVALCREGGFFRIWAIGRDDFAWTPPTIH
ncbi:MAG TPA: GTPase domain-containing protein [Myxococcota bacterium]